MPKRHLHLILIGSILLGPGIATATRADASAAQPEPAGSALRVGANGDVGLPLQRGFYVDADVACGDASTATLLLFRGAAISGARDMCSFLRAEQTAPGTWRVQERCELSEGGRAWEVDTVSTWRITSAASFERVNEDGWEQEARLCEQSSLPEPWNENDISELIE